MSVRQRCSAQEQRLDRDVRALRIENDLLAATVLLDKGADIYQLIYKPRDLDVLWKTPWGLRNPRIAQSTFSSTAAWLETCAGGWQELHASSGHPWYCGTYVLAIEPFSSIPGQGLVAAMEKTGTHRTLAAGDSVEAELRAVFYESATGIDHIEADGTAVLREE